MKIVFRNLTAAAVVEQINAALHGRQIGELVKLDLSGNNLDVTVSKLGTSTFSFVCSNSGTDCHIELKSEKIAFAHRAFKDEVLSKLVHVVEKAGGKVIEKSKK